MVAEKQWPSVCQAVALGAGIRLTLLIFSGFNPFFLVGAFAGVCPCPMSSARPGKINISALPLKKGRKSFLPKRGRCIFDEDEKSSEAGLGAWQ